MGELFADIEFNSLKMLHNLMMLNTDKGQALFFTPLISEVSKEKVDIVINKFNSDLKFGKFYVEDYKCNENSSSETLFFTYCIEEVAQVSIERLKELIFPFFQWFQDSYDEILVKVLKSILFEDQHDCE